MKDAATTLTRLVDFLKVRGITALLTNLTSAGESPESTDVDISSLVDTWLLLRDIESGGERNRAIYILKSRGMAHSNQIREFRLTDQGIELTDVCLGPEGVVLGAARQAQEARDKAAALLARQNIETKQRELERKRQALEAHIAALRNEFEIEVDETSRVIVQEQMRETALREDRARMAVTRQADATPSSHIAGKAPKAGK